MFSYGKKYLRDYWSENRAEKWFYIFILLFLIKFLVSFIPPQFTTDLLRNLFYGDVFWKIGFQVYDLSPEDIQVLLGIDYTIIDPTTNRLSYATTPYDYPTVQILFWAIMALLPFPVITAKWVLLIFDTANFFLIRNLLSEKSKDLEKNLVSLIYFAFMFFVLALEGQPEGITLFFMLLALKFLKNKPLTSYFVVAVGLNWKYIPVIMLIYLIYIHRNNIIIMLKGLGIFLITSIALSFPILFSSYILHYILYAGELPNDQLVSNPLAWIYSLTYLSSVMLWIILLFIFIYLLKNPSEIGDFLILLPILLFLKYYRFAFPWYWIWIIPGMIVIKKDIRIQLWLSFLILFPIAIIDFISITNNWGFFFNYIGL